MEFKDGARVTSPQDLERKYDLGKIVDDRKAIELQKNTITKVNNELNNFVSATTQSLENIQDQVDGKITTWFFSGVPTLLNEPAVNWTSETYIEHAGDLYFDKDTGFIYRFTLEVDVYGWAKITDEDIAQALAIANSAKDTADSKRRIFVVEPTTPYDIGDIWIGDETSELKRCIVARAEGLYNENDFIKGVKYTDDAVALDTRAVLDAFQTEVVTEYATTTSLNTTSDNIIAQVSGQLEQKADDAVVTVLQEDVTQLKIDADGLNIEVTDIRNNGVNKVETTTGFKFDDTGLTISRTDEEMSTVIDNDGMTIKRDAEEVLKADHTGVDMENATVRKYLVIGSNSRVEDYLDGTGIFYVGGEE